jgi:hypothetical protein
MAIPALTRDRVVAGPQRLSTSPQAPAPPSAEVSPGAPTRLTGRYRYEPRSGAWWWSPEMLTLHGLPPDAPQPDTGTYLSRQHAEDRTRVVDAISGACTAGRAFALQTRIVRPNGEERAVVLVGEPQPDAAGDVAAVEGVCIDITDSRPPGSDAERAQALQTEVGQLRAAMVSRAAIEQAKGILMLLTSCGDQVAFDLLAHISSHTHRKVRDVAEVITRSAAGNARLPDDVRAIIRDACPPSQPLR